MFKWLKKLFGSNISETPVITQEIKKNQATSIITEVVELDSGVPIPKSKPKAKKTTTKKSATKKAAKINLDNMSKKDLLAHAKKNGINANASMKKADILAAIKNG